MYIQPTRSVWLLSTNEIACCTLTCVERISILITVYWSTRLLNTMFINLKTQKQINSPYNTTVIWFPYDKSIQTNNTWFNSFIKPLYKSVPSLRWFGYKNVIPYLTKIMRNLRMKTWCNQQKPILFLNIERIIVLEVNQIHIGLLSTSTLPKTINSWWLLPLLCLLCGATQYSRDVIHTEKWQSVKWWLQSTPQIGYGTGSGWRVTSNGLNKFRKTCSTVRTFSKSTPWGYETPKFWVNTLILPPTHRWVNTAGLFGQQTWPNYCRNKCLHRIWRKSVKNVYLWSAANKCRI